MHNQEAPLAERVKRLEAENELLSGRLKDTEAVVGKQGQCVTALERLMANLVEGIDTLKRGVS